MKNLLRPTAALLVSCILATLALAAVVACQSPEVIPTASPPTETPPLLTPTTIPTSQPTETPSLAPTATPTSQPADEPSTLLPTGASASAKSPDHPALLLSGLPMDRSSVAFLEFGVISQRPSLHNYGTGVEIMSLVHATNEILDEQQVRSAGITSAAFSITSHSTGAAILLGDFQSFPKTLREAVATGAATLHTYRGLELFVVATYYDLYLAVPDSGTLLLARGEEAVARRLIEETIDRRLDGAKLDESLAGLLVHTGTVDFLYARYLETEDSPQEGHAFPQPIFSAGAGTLNEGDTSALYLYIEFAEENQAEQVEFQMAGQDLYGYNSGGRYPITEFRRDGKVVIAQAVVPDIDVDGLLVGN